MQKLYFTAALVAAGLLAASHVSYANALAPNVIRQTATASSLVVPVRDAGGHGNFSAGRSGVAMGRSGVTMGRATMGHNYTTGRRAMVGQGRAYARHFHHRRGFVGGSIAGWGYDSDFTYSDGGGSCYWNCRNAGYGPSYCQTYSYNFCD